MDKRQKSQGNDCIISGKPEENSNHFSYHLCIETTLGFYFKLVMLNLESPF
jgi:hypothetical protein